MSTARVLVTVGSDHHPFQRLVDWIDLFATEHPHVEVTVQHGTACPPAVATGHDYLEHTRLQSLMAGADAIVTQGGPTGIIEARRNGRTPIVVPRRVALGEHVDDHQVSFARFLDRSGQALVAEDESRLFNHLSAVLADPRSFAVSGAAEADAVTASVERFGHLVADLTPRPRFAGLATGRLAALFPVRRRSVS